MRLCKLSLSNRPAVGCAAPRALAFVSASGLAMTAGAVPCTFNGQPASVANACEYLFHFEQGDQLADVDDGSATGQPDGGVTIDDLLYYLSCFVDPNTRALLNDNCATPAVITGYGPFSYYFCSPSIFGPFQILQPTSTGQGQNNPGGGVCNGGTYSTAIPNDIWFRWTAPTTGLTLISTVALNGQPLLTTDDTRIAVYGFASPNVGAPPCPVPGPANQGSALAYNDDSGGVNNKQSRVAFDAIAGNQYLIQIGGVSACPLGANECRSFEIIDMSGIAPQTGAGFPGTAYSVQTFTYPPLTLNTVAATNLGGCAGAPTCASQPPRRCLDIAETPPSLVAGSHHVVVRMRYANVGGNPARRRLMFLHNPSGTTAWINARCANKPNQQIITAVVDSFSPFALADATCVADFNEDGGVTIDDLLMYMELFERGSEDADVDDGSGTGSTDEGVTIDDLLYFLARFEAGC